MITNNTYYVNELYIPHAKPSITSDVTTVSAQLDSFIDEYERECLIKCLGLQLFREFEATLDSSKANGLKDSMDAKWNELLNGKEYTDGSGKLVYWRGIRFKNKTSDDSPTRSFLANYVYYNFEENYDSFRAGVGNVKPKAKNSEVVSSTPKVIKAWRKMVDMIQGHKVHGTIIERRMGLGVDFYNNVGEVSLYKFITDMNNITAETYANFTPELWDGMRNQMGI
jgi:hypothetical protein